MSHLGNEKKSISPSVLLFSTFFSCFFPIPYSLFPVPCSFFFILFLCSFTFVVVLILLYSARNTLLPWCRPNAQLLERDLRRVAEEASILERRLDDALEDEKRRREDFEAQRRKREEEELERERARLEREDEEPRVQQELEFEERGEAWVGEGDLDDGHQGVEAVETVETVEAQEGEEDVPTVLGEGYDEGGVEDAGGDRGEDELSVDFVGDEEDDDVWNQPPVHETLAPDSEGDHVPRGDGGGAVG